MEENIIKKTCKELGMTQKELAERVGVTDGTVRKWSSGATEIPTWAINFLNLLTQSEKDKKAIDKFKEFIELVK